MSSNSTIGVPGAIPLPPPGMNYLAIIDESLPFLMIGATMGAVLFAMLLALVFFSTPSMRLKPIFILNVIAVWLGISGAILVVYMESQTLKSPSMSLPPSLFITYAVVDSITPLLADCVLLLRLVAVYPRQRTPRYVWLTIIGVPVAVKIGRFINIVFYLVHQTQNIDTVVTSRTGVGAASMVLTVLPNVKIEWIIQVFDDLFSSGLFLWRVYTEGVFKPGQSVSEKVNQLFWISTYNFVFPVLLSLAQIIVYTINEDKYYLIALYIEQANFYFTIMGLVFATVWAAESRWEDSRFVGRPMAGQLSTARFAPGARRSGQKRESGQVLEFVPAPNESMHSVAGESAVSSTPPRKPTDRSRMIENSGEKESAAV
ncbi:hypothetical protein HYDPIDRAFT_118202 [Hydnomerulius pinastri MD-312]|uniref:Uncharacterized protein n=1 Tax=Hydnomerulius pinastri MD-312 TaxID=994086 RepID=A0A0C9VPW7_9AGAM|nr:hypothetical protein HYDPIDRAFT_118202 [Hydnomerulius pinastri MD-312]